MNSSLEKSLVCLFVFSSMYSYTRAMIELYGFFLTVPSIAGHFQHKPEIQQIWAHRLGYYSNPSCTLPTLYTCYHRVFHQQGVLFCSTNHCSIKNAKQSTKINQNRPTSHSKTTNPTNQPTLLIPPPLLLILLYCCCKSFAAQHNHTNISP